MAGRGGAVAGPVLAVLLHSNSESVYTQLKVPASELKAPARAELLPV